MFVGEPQNKAIIDFLNFANEHWLYVTLALDVV
jgi:hypothetical protein